MSDQLRDAFQDLAGRAPAIDATEEASARTWRKARRAKRVTAAASVLVVAVLVGGAVASSGLVNHRQSLPPVSPPYDGSTLAIPNKVWSPSPWTPSTDDAGPLGPLALIATAPRRTSWFHVQDDALFGVSAATGQYRFIDLPDQGTNLTAASGAVLSPDGTKIGYWLRGAASSTGFLYDDVGYAVYNTVSGQVVEHRVATRFGLAPQWLIWSGDSRQLIASFGQYDAGSSLSVGGTSHDYTADAWTPSTNKVLRIPDVWTYNNPSVSGGGRLSFFRDGVSMLSVNTVTGSQTRITLARRGSAGAAFSPDGQLLAFCGAEPGGGSYTPTLEEGRNGYILIARRPTSPADPWLTHEVVTHSPETQIFGWIDARHLLVGVSATAGSTSAFRDGKSIASLDVSTGRLETVVDLVGVNQLPATGLATALINRPFVSRPAPASIRDPRLIPGIVLGLVGLIALIVALVWLVRRYGLIDPDAAFRGEA